MKKKTRILSLGIASAMLLAACAPAAQPPAAGDAPADAGAETGVAANGGQDELRVVMNALPVTLDPHALNDLPSARARRMVFDTLIGQDPNDLSLLPGLATSWEMPDAQTVVLNLREGVYFHNGEPFNAESVRFSILRAYDSAHTHSMVEFVEDVEVVDDYTAIIHMHTPFVPILTQLQAQQLSMLPPVAVQEAEAAGIDFADVAVGTGPFMLEEFQVGSHMTLVRNQDWWGPEVQFERLTFRGIPEQANRLIEIETGNADIALDIAPIDVPGAEANPNVNVHRAQSTSLTYLGFNTLEGPLADIRVRQAISHAIQLEPIVDNAFQGTGNVARSLTTPLTWAHLPLDLYPHDLDRARELLAEAGFPDGEGLDLRIWYNAGNQQRADISEMMQNQLRAVGIELTVETIEWAAYLERTANAEHDMFILGWITNSVDPDASLFMLLHSQNHGAAGNRVFFDNPRVDELLSAGRAEQDYDARMAIYHEIQEIMAQEIPKIVLVNPEELHATRPGVNNFIPTANGNNHFHIVYFD